MTFKERFHITSSGDRVYAPSTIGAPQYTNAIDYKIFKKTPEQKLELKVIKGNHKKELLKEYNGRIGKNLNIPSRQIPKPIIFTT